MPAQYCKEVRSRVLNLRLFIGEEKMATFAGIPGHFSSQFSGIARRQQTEYLTKVFKNGSTGMYLGNRETNFADDAESHSY